MRRNLSMLSITALLLSSMALGCNNNRQMVRGKAPPDPLLVTKRPVEGKPAMTADPLVLSRYEPTPPPPLPSPDVLIANGQGPRVGARLLGLAPPP